MKFNGWFVNPYNDKNIFNLNLAVEIIQLDKSIKFITAAGESNWFFEKSNYAKEVYEAIVRLVQNDKF